MEGQPNIQSLPKIKTRWRQPHHRHRMLAGGEKNKRLS
jgi:hypothetical protein